MSPNCFLPLDDWSMQGLNVSLEGQGHLTMVWINLNDTRCLGQEIAKEVKWILHVPSSIFYASEKSSLGFDLGEKSSKLRSKQVFVLAFSHRKVSELFFFIPLSIFIPRQVH